MANFQTLVIAGLGSIGGSMFAVGKEHLRSFPRLVAVDREARRPLHDGDPPVEVLVGDVTDASFLRGLLKDVPGPVLFLNLCAGIDHLRVRETLARLPAAYLDSACCTPEGSHEYRYSRMMPYSLTPVESPYPHWLCWGINPGVVELVTRMLLRRMDIPEAEAEVTIFEHDGLEAAAPDRRAAVGWCPTFLVEEMLVSPSLVVERGMLREGAAPGGLPVITSWGDKTVACRMVGHEDIWNLGWLLGVGGARFVYGLSPRVMNILSSREAREAKEELQVPSPAAAIRGVDRIAVQVRSSSSGASRTLLWETDHEQVWKRLGVNGVQFQTCASLWLAIRMLQQTRFGRLPGTWCASNLPLTPAEWTEVEAAMRSLSIAWEEADHVSIRLRPNGSQLSGGQPEDTTQAGLLHQGRTVNPSF
jgi:hypothetical protein